MKNLKKLFLNKKGIEEIVGSKPLIYLIIIIAFIIIISVIVFTIPKMILK